VTHSALVTTNPDTCSLQGAGMAINVECRLQFLVTKLLLRSRTWEGISGSQPGHSRICENSTEQRRQSIFSPLSASHRPIATSDKGSPPHGSSVILGPPATAAKTTSGVVTTHVHPEERSEEKHGSPLVLPTVGDGTEAATRQERVYVLQTPAALDERVRVHRDHYQRPLN
jgi:hypothetical protein